MAIEFGRGCDSTTALLAAISNELRHPLLQHGERYQPKRVTASTDIVSLSSNSGADSIAFNFVNLTGGGGGTSSAIFGNSNFGPLKVNGVSVSKAGGFALNLSTGSLNGNFTSLNSSGAANGVLLNAVTGTVTAAAGAITATGATFALVGGAISFTYSGGITQANNAPLVSVSGGHATGALTFNTGTLSASNGTGLQFDNADGTYNFNGTTTLNGGDAGVDILNGSDGAFIFGSGATVSSPSGIAFNVNGGTPAVVNSGSITQNNAQRVVNIDGPSADSVVFLGSTTGGAASTGVNINNMNGNVRFTTLTLGTSGARTNNQAVTVTGGTGTYNLGAVGIFTNNAQGLVVNNADGTLSITSGTVDATGSRAVLIDGPGGLTTLGITLTKVSSSGAVNSNGLLIQDTNGNFTVAGSGGTCTAADTSGCSGGTISNATGADDSSTAPIGTGIVLNNATNISLSRMFIHDHSNYGIRGTTVTGFVLSSSVINGANGGSTAASAGTPFNDGSVRFAGLTGTVSVSNTHISGGWADNFLVDNASGVLNSTFTAVNIGANSATEGNDGIQIEGTGTADVNVTIQNSTFTSSRGDLFQWIADGSAGGDLVFTGNTLSNNHSGIATGGGGVTLSAGASSPTTMNLNTNTFRDAVGTALLIVKSPPVGNGPCPAVPGTLVGSIVNNSVGVAGVANSGSLEGSGIMVQHAGCGTLTMAVTGNQVRQYNNQGIMMQAGAGIAYPGTLNFTVSGNTIANPGNNPSIGGIFQGLHLNNGVTPGDTFQTCVDLGANSINGSGRNGGTDFRLRQRQSTTVRLPGYAGGNTDTNAVVAFGQLRIGGGPSGSAAVDVTTGGGGFIGTGTSCP